MSSTTSLINYNFGGIRRKDSVFSDEKITCSDCQNVELYYTQLNSGVGIRTSKGNTSVTEYIDEDGILSNLIPDGEEVIGIFETIQLGSYCLIVYTESTSQGKLYHFDLYAKTLELLVGELSVTGNASATDFAQGWLDMFVFSNGKEIKYIYSNSENTQYLQIESAENLNLKDQDNRDVKGLGLVVYDDRLWVFDEKVLWYSQQGNCKNFNFTDPDSVTTSGYIEFVKDITAIYPYLGTLAVFFKDSSVLIHTDETTGFKADEESPGGCAGYNSLVFHGTDLYFYDDTKKGVFSFKQIINGDKTLGDNIALDIQEELMEISKEDANKIKALSVVTSDRNEVWFLVPISNDTDYSYILIYDYARNEWIKRKCQHINTIGIYENTLYSAGKHIYEEYKGSDFNGEFIDSYYKCTIFNLGADNTLKITKLPPRLTIDGSYKSHFWVKYVKNYNLLKAPKTKEIKGKTLKSILYYDSNFNYDKEYIYLPSSLNLITKIPSATFKALEITFYTNNAGEEFCIKAIEFSKIKVKQV